MAERKQRRGPGERAGLTRTAILKAAHEVLNENGLDGLTMRALARRLGVAPNSLYSHVDGKTELVDTILDDVLALIEEPDPDTETKAGLSQIMTSTYQVLLDHPDLVPLYLARQGARGPNAERLGDIMLDLLARDGVEGTAALEARGVLIVYTIGFAALTTSSATEPDAAERAQPEELRTNFRNGLSWLLAGITSKNRNT